MTHEDVHAELIARLLEAMIDQPRDLVLDAQPLVGRVNWWAKVHISDTGRIVGIKGAHINSLKVLISAMGLRFGEDWRFEMNEPDPGRRVDKPRVPAPFDYDCSTVGNLLGEVCAAMLAAAPVIQLERRDHPDYVWSIYPEAEEDYKLLATAAPIVGRPDLLPMQPVAAMGTLWRAIGRNSGVNLKVEVPAR